LFRIWESSSTGAEQKGHAEGVEENKRDNARKMKALGISTDVIAQVTGIITEQIKCL